MILILALALPVAATATVSDLIVGYWYMFIDNDTYPEMMQNLGDYDYVLSAYLFTEDGTIYSLENYIKDGKSTPTFLSCGTWEKAKGIRNYTYKMMGVGEGTIHVEEGGDMYLSTHDGQMYTHLRMIFRFNPYSDFSFGESWK